MDGREQNGFQGQGSFGMSSGPSFGSFTFDEKNVKMPEPEPMPAPQPATDADATAGTAASEDTERPNYRRGDCRICDSCNCCDGDYYVWPATGARARTRARTRD